MSGRKREKAAASKAIHKTIRMLEKTFDVKAKGSNPTKRRRSLINKLVWKIRRQ